jgi:hypothetical protein
MHKHIAHHLGQSLDEYFKKKASIIDDNDIILDVVSYFNVDE